MPVVSLLCDLGIPKEAHHITWTAYVVNFGWISSQTYLHPSDLATVVANIRWPKHVITNVRSVTITLGATTNLVLTALTGNFLVCGGAVLTFSSAGRILWIQRAASHVALDSTTRGRYTRAVGIMYGLRSTDE